MALFSERYGYIKPSEVIIRERISPEIQNAICSCFDRLEAAFHEYEKSTFNMEHSHYENLEKFLWTDFLNKREKSFYTKGGRYVVATSFIEGDSKWFLKLDLIEKTLKYLSTSSDFAYRKIEESFIFNLNYEFERFNFAYRVIDNEIVEITSKEEIGAIENALENTSNKIKIHLKQALELYALRPIPDFRNSIKESISAVEAFCREKTGEDTLGKALNKLETFGITMPKMLKVAFDKLYAYTNQPDTGIRHALMDDEGKYTPSREEALFMLVSCSSFLNYLNAKIR